MSTIEVEVEPRKLGKVAGFLSRHELFVRLAKRKKVEKE